MKPIEFSIPLVMLKDKLDDQECYIISCETLGVYSQADTKVQVKQDFKEAVTMLFDKWSHENKLVPRLKNAVNKISNKDIFPNGGLTVEAFEIPDLEVGSLSSIHGSLVAC